MTRRRRPPQGLGTIRPLGPTDTITLHVGSKKGLEPHNREASRCLPVMSLDDMRSFFLHQRDRQMPGSVGATSFDVRGWFNSEEEDSIVIESTFIPTPSESTWEAFCSNQHLVAERLKHAFCQDSVLIVHDWQGRRWASSAEGPSEAQGDDLLRSCDPPSS